ncbi:MAG: DUF2505 family protein [Polyangiaceae bacterium]
MKKAISTQTFDCDADTFWKMFFDREYNKKLYLEGLSFKQFEILELTETTRRMRGTPRMTLPGPVAKLLGDSFGYEEVGTFDKANNIFKWKMIPNTMKDKLFTEGSVKIEPAGDGKVKRTSTAQIEAKVFGLGGVLEGTAEKEMTSSWEKEAVFTKNYLKDFK